MNIDEMPAGPEMDALVAKKLMGWYQEYVYDFNFETTPIWKEPEYLVPLGDDEGRKVPNYSGQMGAAWEVVEKLNELKLGWFSLEQFGEKGRGNWRALIWTGNDEDANAWFADAGTAPLAISRMALKVAESQNA